MSDSEDEPLSAVSMQQIKPASDSLKLFKSYDGNNLSHGERIFKKLSVGIDFTFNTIKDVKKVTWKDDAPWFREVTDGFCWIAYCHNNNLTLQQANESCERAKIGNQI